MATTSAWAVGSRFEVTAFQPRETMAPSRTTTAPNGPPRPCAHPRPRQADGLPEERRVELGSVVGVAHAPHLAGDPGGRPWPSVRPTRRFGHAGRHGPERGGRLDERRLSGSDRAVPGAATGRARSSWQRFPRGRRTSRRSRGGRRLLDGTAGLLAGDAQFDLPHDVGEAALGEVGSGLRRALALEVRALERLARVLGAFMRLDECCHDGPAGGRRGDEAEDEERGHGEGDGEFDRAVALAAARAGRRDPEPAPRARRAGFPDRRDAWRLLRWRWSSITRSTVVRPLQHRRAPDPCTPSCPGVASSVGQLGGRPLADRAMVLRPCLPDRGCPPPHDGPERLGVRRCGVENGDRSRVGGRLEPRE